MSESPWTVGAGKFGRLTPGMRSWVVAVALGNKLAERYRTKVKIRGYQMHQGTWVYSVVADDYQ